ncbi:hypothetical protein WJX72_000293 [[Myrmecia] bisecta]|uniref:Uncharacterized protein n=1 Tax=[Myrmecia] bisecta TaxID=41462 RepID=A0AAW1Q065_9CHLO
MISTLSVGQRVVLPGHANRGSTSISGRPTALRSMNFAHQAGTGNTRAVKEDIPWGASKPDCKQLTLRWPDNDDPSGEFLEMCQAVGRAASFPNVNIIRVICPNLILDDRYITSFHTRKAHIQVLEVRMRAFMPHLGVSAGFHWSGFTQLSSVDMQMTDAPNFPDTLDDFLAGLPASVTQLLLDNQGVARPIVDGSLFVGRQKDSRICGMNITSAGLLGRGVAVSNCTLDYKPACGPLGILTPWKPMSEEEGSSTDAVR